MSVCWFLDVLSSVVYDVDCLVVEEGIGFVFDEVYIGVIYCCGG